MNWFVDVRSGSDANEGKSQKAAFASLPRAVQAAKPGDSISLSPGLYDLELEKQIRTARALGLTIAVTGGH
ncbi:MAG TPA: DUF1565 domain-containing protein [Methyloceanibacter sp.]|jgi:hypothetical protein|nr:DUF1565 domain-containing protein [Methyloceanibacter sp.]